MTELLHEQAGAFSGKYPDIPTRANFQVDENDSAPFFVTLPIGKAGNVSGNGRLYDAEFYSELVRQVNHATQDNPILGIVGHSDPNGASWKVDLPAIEWVGATLESDGMAWGKAYVYPEETKLRGTIRRAMKSNGKVATSIWGEAKMEGNRAINPTIKRIDYADPERAGVKAAVAVPQITSEMKTGETTVSEQDTLLITELRNDRDKARTELEATKTQLRELQVKFDALTPAFNSLKEMSDGRDILVYVSELASENKRMRSEKLALEINALITEQVKLEAGRPLIATMMNGIQSKAEAEKRLSELLNDEGIKDTLKALALMKSGGHAYIGEHVNDVYNEEQAKQKASEIGYGF